MFERRFHQWTLPLLSLAFSGQLPAAQEIPDAPIRVHSLEHAGTACPQGSVSHAVSSKYLAFEFGELTAEIGPGIPAIAFRRTCQIKVTLDVPEGWQYAIDGLRLRGYMELDHPIRASLTASTMFAGQTDRLAFRAIQNGRFKDEFLLDARTQPEGGPSPEVWSSCEAPATLVLNNMVQLTNTDRNNHPHARGYLTYNTIDGTVLYRFNLKWRRCPQG